MRDRTFFGIVIGCFVAGMALAASFVVTGVGHQRPAHSIAWTSK
jgi:hypothetical protein